MNEIPAKPPREFLILYRESNRMFNAYRIDDSQLANEHLNDQTYRNAGIPQREAIHVIEKSYADRMEQRVAELTEALERTDKYLEGLSSGREIGTDASKAGENAKRYAHQIQIELRQALKRDGGSDEQM